MDTYFRMKLLGSRTSGSEAYVTHVHLLPVVVWLVTVMVLWQGG